MQTYFISLGLITKEMLSDYHLARQMLHDLVERADENNRISCHEATRLFLHLPDRKIHWQVQDGHFSRVGVQHSWLWARDMEDEVVILDVYPVATADSMLVHASRLSPWGPLYMESRRSYRDEQIDKWESNALELYEEQFAARPIGERQ